jgi:hypothetical protein
MLDQATAAFHAAARRAKEGEQFQAEIAELRAIVGAERGAPLTKCVAAIARDAREFHATRQQIQSDQKEAAELLRQGRAAAEGERNAREWEAWARRVHGIVTDSFTAAKSTRELQLGLEETVLASLSQRQLKRKLEILRMEKVLLVRGVIRVYAQPSRKVLTLTPLICAAATLHRLRKLAGLLPTNLSHFSRVGDRSPLPEKRFPVLNVVGP